MLRPRRKTSRGEVIGARYPPPEKCDANECANEPKPPRETWDDPPSPEAVWDDVELLCDDESLLKKLLRDDECEPPPDDEDDDDDLRVHSAGAPSGRSIPGRSGWQFSLGISE